MPADVYSVAFLRDMARWAAWLAFAAAALGAAFTRDWRFPLAVAVGAGADIGLLMPMVHRGESSEADDPAGASRAVGLLVAVRLVAKMVLLTASILLPNLLNVWGMLVGVLAVDTTIMTVGSAKAAVRIMR
jgi:hypothetical protein